MFNRNGTYYVQNNETRAQKSPRTLAATNWVVGDPEGAAARLGLQQTTLTAKMQKLGISRA